MLTVSGLPRCETEPIQLSALVENMARVLRSTVAKPFGPTAIAIALGHVSRQDVA